MTPRWRRTDAKASAALAALSQLRRAVESFLAPRDGQVIYMEDSDAARRRGWRAPALIPAILVFLREHAREAAQVSSAAAFTAFAVTPALVQAHGPAHHHVIRHEARAAPRRQHYGPYRGSDQGRKRKPRELGRGDSLVPPRQPAPVITPGPIALFPPVPPVPPPPGELRGPVRDIRAVAGMAREILYHLLGLVPPLLQGLVPAPVAGAVASLGGLTGGISHAARDGTGPARGASPPGQSSPRPASPSPGQPRPARPSPSPGTPAAPSPSPSPSCVLSLLGLCVP